MSLLKYIPTISSFTSRVIILLSTLGVVLVNTRYIGLEAQGTIALINFTILLVVALSNFIGGGANVYLVSRLPKGASFFPSLIWSLLSTALVAVISWVFPLAPSEYLFHALILGWVQALFTYFLQLSLGRERIQSYTLITAVQSISTLAALCYFVMIEKWLSPMAFCAALYIAFGLTALFSLIDNWSHVKNASPQKWKETSTSLIQYGLFAQGGNILHLINLRVPVALLNYFHPKGLVLAGIYSILLYCAEAIWTLAKSLSVILYARVSNTSILSDQRALTQKYIGYSLAFSAAACVTISVLPQSLFESIINRPLGHFSQGFQWFMVGILANSYSIIVAHYFSGIGQYTKNMWASALGLIGSAGVGALLIPFHDIVGAAIGSSVAFLLQALYFFTQFKKVR